MVIEDFESCYRALHSRDERFDGWFFVGVSSTHIYCRPSCPAVTPKRANVRFYATAAAARGAGHRACMRCRPDATPGSPEWNLRADVAGRAMRLVADGVIDREGVSGLARRVAFSERHLHRLLVRELGAGPLALARAQRAQTARTLIETTTLPFIDVAFAAGFSSLRQFNDSVRSAFALTPTELRRRATSRDIGGGAPGSVGLRLPFRKPFAANAVLGFLGGRAVAGIEELDGVTFRRTLRLPHGPGTVALTPADGYVSCSLRLHDLRDLAAAVQRCRRLLDLDADPVATDAHLAADPLLAPLVRQTPGRRVPGTVDGAELAVRAVLGQQVSVASARTHASRLVAALGTLLETPDGGLTHLFPTPAAVADADPALLAMPQSRREAVRGLAGTLAEGGLVLDPGTDRQAVQEELLRLRGIGPWTVTYIAMRALGDPDAFPATDLGVRNALVRLGHPGDPASATERARRWRPWRAYAAHHLWSVGPETGPADVPATLAG